MSYAHAYDPSDPLFALNNQPQMQIQTPMAMLTVSDMVRLAQAGVKLEVGNVVPQPDPMPMENQTDNRLSQVANNDSKLARAIWYRWLRAKSAIGPAFGYDALDGRQLPFALLATQHGDKVWVSVHPHHFNYEPFQLQDDAAIFPSDALMANLALWEQTHPSGGR